MVVSPAVRLRHYPLRRRAAAWLTAPQASTAGAPGVEGPAVQCPGAAFKHDGVGESDVRDVAAIDFRPQLLNGMTQENFQ